MKQILILSCSALAFSVAAAHAGDGNASSLSQVNLAGAGNTGTITQIGDSNNAIVQQTNTTGGGNTATVLQTGSNNIAGNDRTANANLHGQMVQHGASNTLSVNQDNNQMVRNVTQSGDQNTASILQRANGSPSDRTPDHRVWNVQQTGQAGAAALQNSLTIDQRGDTNVVARVTQENDNALGGVNTATIRQRGKLNGANINDVPPDPTGTGTPVVEGPSHGAKLIQVGSANHTSAYQNGSRNNFWLESRGDSNMVDLVQDAGATQSYTKSVIEGDMNDAGYRQTGDLQDVDVSVNGSNFWIRTRQAGNSNTVDYVGGGTNGKVSIQQNGAGNAFSGYSWGDQQYIAVKQSGDNNGVYIDGLNGPNLNKFYVLQTTNDNGVTVGVVDGSYNRLQFIQKGGDGNNIDFEDVYGDQNKIFLTQNGTGNMITGNVGNRNDTSKSNDNHIQVGQIGDYNVAGVSVMGSHNRALVGQKGNNNLADVIQTGDSNSATINQGAANVGVPTIMTDNSVPFQTLDGSSTW
ncbi:curlin [Pseudovibrio sp. JE062]|uniref:curlin n=1 Tax=Pseudovibrio sp. JE062 TaxID=439495 RepID=UPI000186B69D|nr:curlin [Pseudovibrio sp. JE062]EEA96044.1 curlin associated repeat protein, putative [Pseudovibrio sp. JE062]